jgi:hypothetical protein
LSTGTFGLVAPSLVILLWPILAPWTERRIAWRAGGFMLAVALGGLLWLNISAGFSSRYPKPGDMFHLTHVNTGKSYWATNSSATELPTGPVKPLLNKPSVWIRQSLLTTPATAISTPLPIITQLQQGTRQIIKFGTTAPTRAFLMAFKPSKGVKNIILNGEPLKVLEHQLPENEWMRLIYKSALAPEFTLTFETSSSGKIELDYLIAYDGLPKDGPQPKGELSDWTLLSGARVLSGKQQFTWGQGVVSSSENSPLNSDRVTLSRNTK